MNANDAQAWYDKKQAEFDALHEQQMKVAKELTPMLTGRPLDLLIELVDVSGKLSDLQNQLVDECCEMVDTLITTNKKLQKPAQ